jgi:hypothetical protein
MTMLTAADTLAILDFGKSHTKLLHCASDSVAAGLRRIQV